MKERLIGAAVLAILAVWLIPWLLDGPDEPITDDTSALQLPVPSGHVGEIRTEVIDLSPHDGPGGSPAASGGGAGAGVSASARSRESVGGAAGSPAARSGAPADSSAELPGGAPSAAAEADRDGGTAEDASETGSSASTAASSDAPRSSTAGAAGNDASAASAAERTAGDSTASRTGSGSSSSAPSRSAAAASESKPTGSAAPSTAAAADWAVQLGSFGDEDNARRLADRVATFGHSPKISTYRAGGRVMYRVRIGPHATRGAAEAAASTLAAHGFVAQVVTN